jgi:RNase H-like domain found in reverse transcriptase
VFPQLNKYVPPCLQFKPGILLHILCSLLPDTSLHSSIHRSGFISLPGDNIFLPSVLFDTGALRSNYIDQGFVNDNISHLKDFIKKQHHSVRLGDNTTQINLTEILSIEVSFVDSTRTSHSAIINCSIMSMPGTTMIIGLPTILFHFFDYFSDLLRQARHLTICTSDPIPFSAIDLVDEPSYPSCTDTWSIPEVPDSPEELSTPLPSSFSGPLYFLEQSHEKAMEIYFSQFDQHISPDFIAAIPEVISLLKSDLALRVFVPQSWTGLTGFSPLTIQFSDLLPKSLRPKARPINPKLYDNAEKEFKRLKNYFYVDSDSSIASCLVMAPKSTAPFIRFCGDYITINKYINIGHYYIPNVQHSLNKASGFSFFIDLDWTNSFHQVLLSLETSMRLSVQTPWGLVRPLFLPEGVGPASGILQKCVMDIFSDFDSWTIAIFDNLLILAHSYTDAYEKLTIILKRCSERNVVLKFSKSWIGFSSATFFGYYVKKGTFELSEDRKASIVSIPMPTNLKAMQRFLGAALFFQKFMPNYSELTAPLYEMTTTAFDWNSSLWSKNYESFFQAFKSQLLSSVTLFFPDYSLIWILRTDASSVACAAVLIQISSTGIHQPICFYSKKFSSSAISWDIHKKEAYSIFIGVSTFQFLLRPKKFIIETDHANLLYMEQNTAPIITRWRVFLQSFDTVLRHIPGKQNIVADWMSRQYSLSSLDSTSTDDNHPLSIFSLVHGGRRGHPGAKKTWSLLNSEFPGHSISFAIVSDMVASCPTCQKIRLGMVLDIPPLVRHLKPPHMRSRIGVDTLTVTPRDKQGNYLIVVVVEHFSKFSTLYPAKDHSSNTMASCLFQHFCRFGLFDEIISDPGSDLTADVVIILNKWFGVSKLLSLVDRHESNGVEPTNKKILRHLRALIFDFRISQDWSDPSVLSLIEYFLNSAVHSETGISPLEAKFGSEDAEYYRLPQDLDPQATSSQLLLKLNDNLKTLRSSSLRYQQELLLKRTHSDSIPNYYQPGDFVLHLRSTDNFLPSKLSPKFLGPYIVESHLSNNVTCRNMITDAVSVFHVSRLKLFVGDKVSAYAAALRDNNQYEIASILAYRGDPLIRTSMQFEVSFTDNTILWKYWDLDLFATVPYENFCRSRSELFPLIFNLSTANAEISRIKSSPITLVKPGDTVFVDIRSWGSQWYSQLNLPDPDHSTYVVPLLYNRWANPKKTKLEGSVPIFNEHWTGRKSLDAFFVFSWGSNHDFDKNLMTLVDDQILLLYPSLLLK